GDVTWSLPGVAAGRRTTGRPRPVSVGREERDREVGVVLTDGRVDGELQEEVRRQLGHTAPARVVGGGERRRRGEPASSGEDARHGPAGCHAGLVADEKRLPAEVARADLVG